ncbi:MAG: uroporphyrinogen-III C-methyltransferase, partial [Angustibacter sp.]
ATTGRVILVGGGPGDPGLLTRRGHDRLLAADVVVVDRLAPLSVLAELSAEVEIIDVAKIPRGPAVAQSEIHRILIDRARAGRVVVRLKGGDPFVFGRGLEEIQACTAAGVAVEVVPGVTSAVSVPGLAGIPVTHRGVAQGFTVVSGHLPPDHPESTINWGALARSNTTIVCLMGVHSMPAIAAELLDQGMPANTPVAALADGGLPSARTALGVLGDLAELLVRDQISAPAVVVIGWVADLGPG